MKQIGKGLQYCVYDLGNNRVIKIPTTKKQKILTFIKWGYLNPFKMYKDVLSVEKITLESFSTLQKQLKDIDLGFLGNPVFKEDLVYEQDKAIPLGVFFDKNSFDQNKKVFDFYIENVFETWKYGFSDTIFNFTINNAIDDNRNVILIDLGELTFSKQDVADIIASKKWLRKWSYNQLSGEFKKYVEEKMSESLTSINLDKYWLLYG